MTNKIQEITEKIYNEGVLKAKEEAAQIIDNAKKVAEQIINQAKKQESEILIKANAQALENKKNITSELQLAALQFTSNLKQQITNSIFATQTNTPLKEAFHDTEFIKQIIKTTIQNWTLLETEEIDLKVLLPEKNKKEFTNFLKDKTIETLNSGITIEFDSKTKNGFKIGPKNGNYIISFEEKDFENFFKKYFRESTRKMLFDS